MNTTAAAPEVHLHDIVECPICTEVYNDPRSLPCNHSYCLRCITDLCKNRRPGDKVACPLCRRDFTIPLAGIHRLPRNVSLAKLLNVSELSEFANIETSFEVSENGTDEDTCDKHRNKPIEVYCFVCNTAICRECNSGDHAAHASSDIIGVVGEFRTALERDVKRITCAIRRFAEKLDALKSRQISCLEHVQKVETEICERAERLKAIIDGEKHKLLTDLLTKKAYYEKQMDNVREEIGQSISLLESLKTSAKGILMNGSVLSLTRKADGIRERARQLDNAETFDEVLENWSALSSVVLSPPGVDLVGSKNILGEIINAGVKPSKPKLIQALSGPGEVTAVAVLNDLLFVTRSGQPQVCVYDTTSFQLERQLTFPGLGIRLWGLATCATNKCLYVSDFDNSSLHRVDLSAFDVTVTVVADEWKVSKHPRGLSVNSDCNVFVAYYSQRRIQEYTTGGSLVREISDDNYLWQAVHLNSGLLAVSRGGPVHGVAMVSTDGQVIQSFGNTPGSGMYQMHHPRSLTVDKCGCVLVADRDNNRILVVNQTYTDARPLPLPVGTSLKCPREIYLDQPRGRLARLYIGEGAGLNRLLVFENVINFGALFAR